MIRFVRRARLRAAEENVAFSVLQEQVGIRVQLAQAQTDLLRLRQGETVVVNTVAIAVEVVPRESRTL